jgi:hypothetical protein
MIANSHDLIEGDALECIEPFGAMTPDIDADLRHRCNGAGMDPGRRRTRAIRLPAIPLEPPEQSFGHLRPGRVVRADEKDSFPPLILRLWSVFHHSDSFDVYMKMLLFIFIILCAREKCVHGG